MYYLINAIWVVYWVFIYKLVKLAIQTWNKEMIFLSILTSLLWVIYAILIDQKTELTKIREIVGSILESKIDHE
jgi:hypothetical protein